MKWRPGRRVNEADLWRLDGALAAATLIVVLIVLVALVVRWLVPSGWSGLETAAGSVDDKSAAAFLSTADADWRNTATAQADKSVNLPLEARCYFVTAVDDGSQSLGTMACGPVRRLGTAEGAVWDVTRIEGAVGGGQAGEVGLRLVNGAMWQLSVPRPDPGKFVRPDGQEPADGADHLAAPPTPRAEPGLIKVQSELDGKFRGVDGAAERHESLVTPDVTVTLTGLGTVDTIGTGSQIKAPASGEQFIVARFTAAKTRDPVTGAVTGSGSAGEPARDSISAQLGRGGVETSFAIAADGEPRPVDLIGTDKTGTDQPGEPGRSGGIGLPGGGYLVASVPTGAKDVSLTATTQGVTQNLSLLTGKRTNTDTSGSAMAYYRTNRLVTLNQRLPPKQIRIGRDFNATYTITLTKAGLTAWDPEQGWAPRGRAWLRFGYTESWDQPSALYEITWNPRFFTATADDRPITLPTDYNTYTKTLTTAVPADAKTIRITVTATLRFLEKPGINYAQPTSGTADFGTLTSIATFD